ncbi:MAG: Gfo/Idh/MocA family oxidoreductase [Phycisphaerae bacterium]|jgi:predicted dehydrogenase
MRPLSRRTFIGTAAAVGTGIAVGQNALGANAAVNVGVIGCGGRGRYLIDIFRRIREVRLVAVCDVNEPRAADAQKAIEPAPKLYKDFRELIAHPGLNAVIIATNGHWHVLPAIHACQAGLDVYLEKPVGTSIGEGRVLVNVARQHNRVIQVGTQQHSWEHYRQAVEIIRAGKLGDISNVHAFDLDNFSPGFGAPPDGKPPAGLDWDFWLGPSPSVAYNPNRYHQHYWFFDYGGAWELDWAVHHYDIVHWAMNVTAPVAATGSGGKFAFPASNTQWPDTFTGTCEYGPGPVAKNGFLMTYVSRAGCDRPIEGRRHGKVFYGTDATLALDRSGYEIYSQTREGKKVVEERSARSSKPENDVVEDHARGFLAAMQSRKPPNSDIESLHQASNPGHLMNIAWRVGRRVRWDAVHEQVIDDPQAQAYVTKPYRQPWKLPVS